MTEARAEKSNSGGPSRVLGSAAVMGFATFLSRILGLVREQVFAYLFGAGHAVDAFQIAFRIPNLLRDLFAEGAMSAALIPTFTRVHETQGPHRAWALAARVFRVLFVVVAVIAIAGMIFAEPLVDLYAGAFRQVPGKFELAVEMTRILFPFFPLVALAAGYMAVLNARGVFFMPAFASALFNVFSVLGGVALTWIFARTGLEPILGMAIGVVLGGAAQAFCQLPSLRRKRWEELPGEAAPKPEIARGPLVLDADLRSMMLLMVPGTLGLAATQVNILVNSVLATAAGAGAVAWLNYAFRLMQFPIGVFGVSFAQATLPRVSSHWVKREYSEASATLERSLAQVFAINLPAAAGLGFLAVPIIAVIFEHGRFTAADTAQTALALAAYSAGLAAYSAVKVLVPAFYAFGNTRIPVISSVLSVVLTIGFNLAVVDRLGFWGLALGTSVAAYANMFFLLWSARSIVQGSGAEFSLGRVGGRFLVHLVVALAMGAVCHGTWLFLDSWRNWGEIRLMERLFWLAALVVEGGGFILLVAKVLRVAELSEVLDWFAAKILRRFRKKIV